MTDENDHSAKATAARLRELWRLLVPTEMQVEFGVKQLPLVKASKAQEFANTVASVICDVYDIERLRGQLPEGMEDCTIKFIECPVGHGRLTATNWVQHGCDTCRINKLKGALSHIEEKAGESCECDSYNGFVCLVCQIRAVARSVQEEDAAYLSAFEGRSP